MMTANEAKRIIYRKCKHCKFYSCGVCETDGEPLDDFGMCIEHGYAYRDGDEDACRSFDYARWVVAKTLAKAAGEDGAQ